MEYKDSPSPERDGEVKEDLQASAESAGAGGNTEKPDAPEGGSGKKKKAVLTAFAVIGALAVLLALLNMIDFDAILEKAKQKDGDKDKEQKQEEVVTIDPAFFVEPDYDEDIMLDREYLKENLYLHYTEGNETFEVIDRGHAVNDVCRLFYDYFEALKKGDSGALYSFFTEDCLKENGKKNFTAQKVYNINVRCIGSSYLENGDSKGEYQGYTVHYCDVQYNIKDNNGTFRNDYFGDDATLPMVFEILEKNGYVRISDVSYYSSAPSGGGTVDKKSFPVSVMFFVWLAAFVIFAIITPVTGKPGMIGVSASALVTMFLTFVLDLTGIAWLSVILQIIIFAGLSVLFWHIVVRFVDNKKRKLAENAQTGK